MADKIVVGLVSRTYFNMPLWIAADMGYFAEEGLEVSSVLFGNASQVEPLLDGSYQFVIGSPESIITNAAEGGPLRIVSGNTGQLVHSLIARAPFKRIEALKGATIGILSTHEGVFFHVKAMLAAHGLHYPGDYQTKVIGGVPPRHQALLEGSIDAGAQSVPWNFVAVKEGMNNFGELVDYVPDWQFVSVNANSQWAAANPALVEGFLRALARGTEWFYANRAGSSAIAARELPSPLDLAELAWDHFTGTNAMTRDMSPNLAGLKKAIAILIEDKLLAADAPADPAYYVEDRYLRAARARIPAVK